MSIAFRTFSQIQKLRLPPRDINKYSALWEAQPTLGQQAEEFESATKRSVTRFNLVNKTIEESAWVSRHRTSIHGYRTISWLFIDGSALTMITIAGSVFAFEGDDDGSYAKAWLAKRGRKMMPRWATDISSVCVGSPLGFRRKGLPMVRTMEAGKKGFRAESNVTADDVARCRLIDCGDGEWFVDSQLAGPHSVDWQYVDVRHNTIQFDDGEADDDDVTFAADIEHIATMHSEFDERVKAGGPTGVSQRGG